MTNVCGSVLVHVVAVVFAASAVGAERRFLGYGSADITLQLTENQSREKLDPSQEARRECW